MDRQTDTPAPASSLSPAAAGASCTAAGRLGGPGRWRPRGDGRSGTSSASGSWRWPTSANRRRDRRRGRGLAGRMLPVHTRTRSWQTPAAPAATDRGSFNISTAAAIVAAAAGLPVAKHGNRAVSSRTGSADVLERWVCGRCIHRKHRLTPRATIGLCFCLAPVHHPAMARVGPLRRSLGTADRLQPRRAALQSRRCIGAGDRRGPGRGEANRWPRRPRLLGAARTLVVSGHVGDGDGHERRSTR
jgi:hypothetical protein